MLSHAVSAAILGSTIFLEVKNPPLATDTPQYLMGIYVYTTSHKCSISYISVEGDVDTIFEIL